MSDLKVRTKTLDEKNSPKVTINAEEPKEKELWVNGLKKTITHNSRQGYEIGTYKCLKCGQEQSVDKPLEGVSKYCSCGGRMVLKDVMKRGNVQDIVSREAAFVCPKCGRVYHYPVDCCVAKMKLTQAEMYEFNVPRRSIYG